MSVSASVEVRNLENKIKSGIIHCANYTCNGCPYDCIRYSVTDRMNSSAGYVRCMQQLIDDIYNEMKEDNE